MSKPYEVCSRCGVKSYDLPRHRWQSACRIVDLNKQMDSKGYVRAGNTSRFLRTTDVLLIKWPSTCASGSPNGNDKYDFFWSWWGPEWAVILAGLIDCAAWQRRTWVNGVLQMPYSDQEERCRAIEAAYHLNGASMSQYTRSLFGSTQKVQHE